MARDKKSSAHDAATLAFYAHEAPLYVATASNRVNPALTAFMHALPQGARVLELGCGGGKDAETMLAQGFNVDATDGTPEMVALASERLGRDVRLMRFDELNDEARYDGVWANASLLHAPREALPTILTCIFRALVPGGHHAASYKGGGVAGRDTFGRYYNYTSKADLIAVYRASAPWAMLAVEESTGKGCDRLVGPWLSLTALRPLKEALR